MEARLQSFAAYLEEKNKSQLTKEKYLRDLRFFLLFQGDRALDQDLLLAYKEHLIHLNYAPRSINSMLSAVKAYAAFYGIDDCHIKPCKIPRRKMQEDAFLTPEDLARLLSSTRKDTRMFLLIKVLTGTNVRFPELQLITREVLETGAQEDQKETYILFRIPRRLRRELLDYANKVGIKTGPIFVSRNGLPLDRCNVCHSLKTKAQMATIDPDLVNARMFRYFYLRYSNPNSRYT